MTPTAEFFEPLYVEPVKWIYLFEELEKARLGIVATGWSPNVFHKEGATIDENIRLSLREAFGSVSQEVAVAMGCRFEEDGWPPEISEEARYFIRKILSYAMKTLCALGPTPREPLKQTIIPFPNATVNEVALWFATDWWLSSGGALYEDDMIRHAKSRRA